jgi:pimeloyl-ACP methyl ester carboxylesterase
MRCLVRGIPVHYEEVGAGRPLLMLHGMFADHRQVVNDMEPLFVDRPGWRRIYPDSPGMGQTPGPDWITGQDGMLQVVLEFIATVAPGQHFVVAGVSYGGYLARGLINRRQAQINGLLLTVPVVETDASQQNYPAHQVLVEEPGFQAALRADEQGLRDLLVIQNHEVLDYIRDNIAPAVAHADQKFLQRVSIDRPFSFAVDILAEPFPAPVLILAGRQDSVVGYREAWRLLDNYPRATFAVLDRAGHALAGEQQTVWRCLVSEWLDRVEEYVAAREGRHVD